MALLAKKVSLYKYFCYLVELVFNDGKQSRGIAESRTGMAVVLHLQLLLVLESSYKDLLAPCQAG